MARNTGNISVIGALQNALMDFLNDHREFAKSDPERVAEFTEIKEREDLPGCGCEDCQLAGQLRGSI
jgi:hypothetical protein